MAQYDGTLMPMADFLRHLAQTDDNRMTQPPCDDLGIGFIVVQEGG